MKLAKLDGLLFTLLAVSFLAVGCKVAEGTVRETIGKEQMSQESFHEDSSMNDTTEHLETIITLERTPCFGTCPVYRLTISGDGTVVYEGEEFVKVKGKHTAHISPDIVQELLSEFEQIDYFSLKDRYTKAVVADHPSAITSLTIGGNSKTVEHDHGDINAPEALTQLERRIDEIVSSDQWTGHDLPP